MAIKQVFHIIHMTDRLEELEAWYADVFAVKEMLPHHYFEGMQRDASLVLLGDTVIEPLAPAFHAGPAWEDVPLGRYYKRFGTHWHSIAYYSDDVAEVYRNAAAVGVRAFDGLGRLVENEAQLAELQPSAAINLHPKDAFTQVEVESTTSPVTASDPRFKEGWDPDWWIENHPVKTPGHAYLTVLADDLVRAEEVYTKGLSGTVVHRGTSELTGTEDVYVKVGESTVQLSRPTRDGTLAAEDAARNKDTFHAAAFRVQNLDDTEAYFATKGITTLARDETTLLTDPATTFGVPFRWTTWDVPGGHRDAR